MTAISVNNNDQIKVEIVSGKWKNDATKEWKAVKVTIGTWSQMIFPKTSFEMEYIESIIEDQI